MRLHIDLLFAVCVRLQPVGKALQLHQIAALSLVCREL